MTQAMIQFQNVEFTYPAHSFELPKLSFQLNQNSFISILGENGVGKTTLLKLMANLIHPHQGNRLLNLIPYAQWTMRNFSKKISFIPTTLDYLFPIQVKDFVALGRAPHLNRFSFESPRDLKIIQESLDITHTVQFQNRYLHTLSSGEKQRVLLAKTLAQNADILLIDEITAHLDTHYQSSLFTLLREIIQKTHVTVCMVHHAPDLAEKYSDEIFVLKKEGLVQYEKGTN